MLFSTNDFLDYFEKNIAKHTLNSICKTHTSSKTQWPPLMKYLDGLLYLDQQQNLMGDLAHSFSSHQVFLKLVH